MNEARKVTTPSIMIASQSTERVVKKSQRPMVNQGMASNRRWRGGSAWGRTGASFAPRGRDGAWAAFQVRVGVLGDEEEDEEAPTMAAIETVAERACFSRPSWRAMRTLKKKAPAHKTGASQA